MKKIIVISLISLLAIVGCNSGNSESAIEESGTIEVTSVILSSKTNGELISVLVDEGDFVEKGDTLAIVDSESLVLQLNQLIAGRKAAEAQLRLLEKGARSEDKKQSEELLNQAQNNLNLAATNRSRFQSLLDERAITQAQFDEIDTKYNISLSQYNSAKANYNKVQKISRDEEIEMAKANLNKAIAGEQLIRKTISDSYIISPIQGQIVRSFAELGELIIPMSSIFKVSDQSKAELVIYVSEESLGKIKLGQKVEISNDTYTDKVYEGKVTYISPEAEFTPKNIQTQDERTKLVFAVKVSVPNPDFELKAGMPADAVIRLKD